MLVNYGSKVNCTDIRVTSASRAPVRALAEYLETIRFPEPTGGSDKFLVVKDGKADVEDIADYPAAVVYAEGPVRYGLEDGALEPVDMLDIEGARALMVGEISMTVLVHVWTNEDEHREIVLQALEDAFSPVEWMSGFQLEMPHYYNCRAQYQLSEMVFEDSPDDVQRRYRKLSAQLTVRSPYVRLFSIPKLEPRNRVEVG